MKKFLKIFFITLGIIFFILILGAGYVYFADPFGIRELWQSGGIEALNEPSEKNPNITKGQEAVLKSAGIDAESITSFTPEQEACFVEKFGEQRVDEIKAGSTPTMSEIFEGRDCL
jgi:hypothetical protein